MQVRVFENCFVKIMILLICVMAINVIDKIVIKKR